MLTRCALLSLSMIALGCSGKDGPSDDTGGLNVQDDTGSTGDDTGVDPSDFEEGCHTVDGYGFANVADAVAYASEGAVIELCDGTISETVVISKSVTLLGPGTDRLTWDAPSNSAAIEIAGGTQVSISGLSIISTRNGIVVDGAAEVALDDLHFLYTGSTAVTVADSTDVTLTACTFDSPAYGAVAFEASTGAVYDSTLNAPLVYGVHAVEGSTVTIEGSAISDTLYDESGSGGYGVYVETDSVVTSLNNTYVDNLLHVYAYEADLVSSGDQLEGGAYGFLVQLGEVDVSGGLFTDVYYNAVGVITDSGDISLSDTTISGAPDAVEPDAFAGEYIAGGLYLATDGEISLTGVTVEGYNSIGALLGSWDIGPAIYLEDVALESPGRYGLYINGAEGELVDVEVSGQRIVDGTPAEIASLIAAGEAYLDSWGAVMLLDSDLSWSGGGVYDSEHLGVFQYSGDVTYDGVTISNNGWAGIWSYNATNTIQNSVITESSGVWGGAYYSAGLYNYASAQTIVDNTFIDNRVEALYYLSGETTSSDGKSTIAYDAYGIQDSSRDLYASGASYLTIDGNTFENGSQSLYLYGGENISITNNEWSGYHQSYTLYFTGHDDGDVTFSGNTISEASGPVVYCNSSELEIEDLSIDALQPTVSRTHYYDADLNQLSDYEYSYYSYNVYGYGCDLELDTVDFTDTPGPALYSYSYTSGAGSLELYDVTITGDGGVTYGSSGAIIAYYLDTVLASGVTIADWNNGAGLYIYNYEDYATQLQDISISDVGTYGVFLGSGDHELSDVDVARAGSYGLYMSAVSSFTLDADSSSNENSAHGLYLYASDGSLSGSTFNDNAGSGVYVAYSDDVTLDGITATGNATHGVYLDYSGVELVGSVLSGNTNDGVQSTNFSDVSASDNDANENGGYGMSCYDVILDTCEGNDLSGNTLGEHDGCDACDSSSDTGL